jgi:peroxiredoxin
MDATTAFLAHRSKWSMLFVSIVCVGLSVIWISSAAEGETTAGRTPAPREGFLAPAFELETLDGGAMSLADHEGQVVVLNLWASWCPPCRAEMPALQSLYEEYRDQGLVVLAVNMTYQDSAVAAAEFVAEFGLSFPVLLDQTGLVGNLYRMRALPSTFFIDRQGVIRNVIVGGPVSEITLQSMVAELLEQGA